MRHDLRYALRTLWHSPGFTSMVVLSLALGIGANTAIFSLIDAVLLKMLPVPEPEQLFLVESVGARGRSSVLVSYPLFGRLREALGGKGDLAALTEPARLNAAIGRGVLEPAYAQLVSGEYFRLLGIEPLLGRVLMPEDRGAAVISHGYWQRRFGGDPAAVGRAITLNGAPFTIVGVAPRGFFGASVGRSPDLWLPLELQAEVRYAQNAAFRGADLRKPWPPQEGVSWLNAIARVRSRDTVAAANSALNVVYRRDLERRAQGTSDVGERQRLLQARLDLAPGGKGFDSMRKQFSQPLGVLMAMVALLLLIACANVANLLLARGAARRREVALRLAIGAGRAHLVRQFLTESVLLALAGGVLGLLFGRWSCTVLLRLMSNGPAPLPLGLSLDYRLLAFTAAVSIASGILFGLVPAFRDTSVELGTALKASAIGGGTARRFSLGKLLVILQVGLSLVLLSGAGLLARSLRNLADFDPGFAREQVLSVRIDPRAAGYGVAQLPGLYQRLLERVRTLPGVRSASIALSGVAGDSILTSRIRVSGRTPRPGEDSGVQENLIAPGYFATVGMSLLQGRDIDPRDTRGAPQVAVVNQTMVRYFFPNENPIGRRFGYGAPPHDATFEIVGVVRDARVNGVREKTPRLVFRPLAQQMEYAHSLDLRVAGDPRAVSSQIRQTIAGVAPDLPVVDVAPLAEYLSRTFSQERLIALLTGFFSLLALALACLGLYGVMSYAVTRRTSELGIRMALGAQRTGVLWLVLREALVLVGIGLALGLPLTLAAARALASQLFGIKPSDPPTLGGAATLMVLVAAVAGYLPARRAARVDPMVALRDE